MAQLTWNDLFTAGTLIDYSVHLWRARIQLKAEDLGVAKTEEVQKALSFGCHRLAPAESFEVINSIVRSFQKDIEEYSLAFPLLQGVRFVPDEQVKALQKKMDLRLREFNYAVNDFLEDYDINMQKMLIVIEQALNEAAKSPQAAATALSRVISEYPSKQEVAKKFGLEWKLFSISMPMSKSAAQSAAMAMPQVTKAVTSMVEQLRSELAEKVGGLITLVQKVKEGKSRTKDGFDAKSKESALSVLAKVDRLNFFGDRILAEQTSVIRRMLESDDCNPDRIAKDLNHVRSNLEGDIQAASAEAERKLTGIGRRKLQMADETEAS